MKVILAAIQIAILYGFSLVGSLLSHWLHIDIPGSILGLILLFILLRLKVIRVEWLERGGNWLIANLLLFFIPPAVGVLSYQHLMETKGEYFVLVIALSTVLVMVSTGLVTEFLSRVERRRRAN
ncbi:CidA/LrgA family protein [Alicyclobacillus tolerans]|uniref:CidA/LrgA family protein n=1 Tax=Alicyclobacillus tolerans TaxID=90970 RepID=UPI001F2BC92B|nr:CidA/LrgA family protein [Alicyclobacillus tolerans]MCF8564086.1 CidA/LrgA family protein [Alicyclobacillus tolerans]